MQACARNQREVLGMSDQQLKAGDVVQLKSGGPEMTISKIINASGPLVVCDWFYMDAVHEERHRKLSTFIP
jgi:uncharacterized protein YodC (DUF2158 family)